MKKHISLLIFIFCVWLVVAACAAVKSKCKTEQTCFSNSLHHTGEGMRYWYEEPNGMMKLTGIAYDKLACKACHAKSCDVCHAEQKDGKCAYTAQKARRKDTCLQCHARAKAAIALGKEQGSLDVHIAAGMVCTDCHKADDVHGDGTAYHSMRDKGAVKASCTNEGCHPPKEKQIRPHTVHRGKLHCTACHVSNSMACLNCHMDRFIETGKKEGNYLPPAQNWLLLVNYDGQITSGSVQTAVYKDKKFIAYAPYFTHSIQAEAKKCTDCHGNQAMQLLSRKKSVPMAKFKDGKMQSFEGVVPLDPDRLDWDFLTKKDNTWTLIDNNEPPHVQFVGHGKPLTKVQIKKMAMPFKK